MNKTTFRQGPIGMGRVASVVFFTDGGPNETIETAPSEDIGDALHREFTRRTNVTILRWTKTLPAVEGVVTYTLFFAGGETQDVMVRI